MIYSLVFGLTDVILRYFLNRPSLWISVTVQYAMVLLACVSGAYALNHDAFVKLDLFYARFSPRTQGNLRHIDLLSLRCYTCLCSSGRECKQPPIPLPYARVTPTAIPIPLYHLKSFIPVGAFFTLLVAIKKLVQDFQILIKGSAN
ncbi:MAG: TRAP transporter small permease subunit [Bacillota bacterium]